MIVVKVELWPFGNEDAAQELERVFIVNDGTGSVMEGNYAVFVGERQLRERRRTRKGVYIGAKRVKGHWRTASVLGLVERAFAGLTATNQFGDYLANRSKR